MTLSKIFYGLFSGSLLVLFCLLAYGWKVMYASEEKRIQEDIDHLVQNTADTVQKMNYPLYDLLRVIADKDYSQKIAFASGITRNQKKFAMRFDSDEPDTTETKELRKHQSDYREVDTIKFQLPVGSVVHYKDSSVITGKKGNRRVSAGTVKLPPGKATDSVVLNISPKGPNPLRIAVAKKTVDTPGRKYVPAGVKKIAFFDSLLKTELKQQNLPVTYEINRVLKTVQPVKYQTGMFIINFFDPDLYYIIYQLPPSLVVRRLFPYTAISVLLLLMVSGAFLLYHKSYRMQLQTAQFRESLLGNVTHELKTPVSSLQLIINSLSADPDNRQKEYIEFAGKELNRMKTLIEKILSFSKLNERQFALSKEIIQVTDLVEETVQIITPALASNCGTITTELQAAELMGDRILLLNMLVNLADNAIKYSVKKPLIHISVVQNQGLVRIMVRDNGMGIPAQYQKKIFEPFFRIPTGDLYTIPGHGIGLSFVRQVVKLHNGSITVSSSPGEGSTFFIQLPSL